jgi:AcrR family transcriptional regulator
VNELTRATDQAMSEGESTTRDRILRAAMHEFAAHGFRGASIRGIAAAAGVSAGLVQHHFGTKDGLRDACDVGVMEFLSTSRNQLTSDDAALRAQFIVERMDELQPMIDYLTTSLSSGSETAAKWFKAITDYTHESLVSGRIGPELDRNSHDSRAIAAVQAAMALGVTAFYRNIQQVLDIEDEAEMIVRVGRARLFLASDRIVGEETRTRLLEALDEYELSKTTGKPPPDEANKSVDNA